MALYRTEGIILRSKGFGEADRLLVIYTRDHGKVRGVARGARRPRSRFAGSTQAFTYAEFLVFGGSGLDNISQVEVKDAFGAIRGDLDLMAYASYMAELLDAVTEEGAPNEALFGLLLTSFRLLASGVTPEVMNLAFEVRLMALLGYKPMLERCAVCGGQLSEGGVGFSAGAGGAICGRCLERGGGFEISRDAITALMRLLTARPGELRSTAFPVRVSAEVNAMLRAFIDFRLDRKLKSLGLLRELGGRRLDSSGPRIAAF